MLSKALSLALSASVAFGAWQYIRAERLADKAARLSVCEEVNDIANEVRDETDDGLADLISNGVQ